MKKSVSSAALWSQVKLMKRRLAEYMCDSLGDNNQAEVHFLGIGSQLRGAVVPRVIKHSQPVIDCTTASTAHTPQQKKEPCPAQSRRILGILPLLRHLWSSWDVRNLCANLGDRANHPINASCRVW